MDQLPGAPPNSSSLGHKEGVDPKVAANQRGHAIGVAIDTYTESDLESRREAVTKLEQALADRKPADPEGEPESSAEPTLRGKPKYDCRSGVAADPIRNPQTPKNLLPSESKRLRGRAARAGLYGHLEELRQQSRGAVRQADANLIGPYHIRGHYNRGRPHSALSSGLPEPVSNQIPPERPQA